MRSIGNTLLIVLFCLLMVSSLSIQLFKAIELYYQGTHDDQYLSAFTELEECLHLSRDNLQDCKHVSCVNEYKPMLNIFSQSISWWQQNATLCPKQNWVYRDLLKYTPENNEYLYRISVFNAKHMILTATFHRGERHNVLQEVSWFQSTM